MIYRTEVAGMRHIKEIFSQKDLSVIDNEYNEFLQKKKQYLQNKTNNNYLELVFAYELVDAYLKSILSDGYITLNELQYIRAELKEGLIE